MKEVIMKKLLFWMVLIVGIVALIGSCAKKDDSTTAASTSVTSTTASGSITVGSETLSGTYVSECNTTQFAAAAGTSVFPSDVKSGKTVIVVTSDTTISDEMLMYTDTSCSTPTAYTKNGNTSVTVGVASGSNYLVTYASSTYKVQADTTVAETHLEAFLLAATGSAVDLTVGTEHSMSGSGNTYKNVWSVTSTTIQTGEEEDNGTQPTEMDSMVMTKE
ncbi:uncharacterized protein METZ01_LOCUS197509 [marine metagenome]|uniref:Uncharacterized protein n=1 Tax=marine metagenome TaxID=408172 RepID=A0A382E2G1_9ZZZZ